MRQRYWVGLDVGERTTSVCALDAEGAAVLQEDCVTDVSPIAAILRTLGKRRLEAVAVEACANGWLLAGLRQAGFPIISVDPGKVHKFLSLRVHKTDRNDAQGLAEAIRFDKGASLRSYEIGADCRQIRDRLALREQLIRQRNGTRGALRAALRKQGSQIQRLVKGKKFRCQVETELERVARLGGVDMAKSIAPLLDLTEALEKYIRQLDLELRQILDSTPPAQRLTQVPGVGPVCALSFYSLIENPDRFPRPVDVGAYLGLVPRLKQSGTASRRSRITRAGNALTRSHLASAARVLLSCTSKNSALRDWGKAVAAKIGYGRARVAVARKLAVVLLSMWKAEADFQPYPDLGTAATPL